MQFTGNCAHVTMVLCVVVGCNDHSDSGSNKGISFYIESQLLLMEKERQIMG